MRFSIKETFSGNMVGLTFVHVSHLLPFCLATSYEIYRYSVILHGFRIYKNLSYVSSHSVHIISEDSTSELGQRREKKPTQVFCIQLLKAKFQSHNAQEPPSPRK